MCQVDVSRTLRPLLLNPTACLCRPSFFQSKYATHQVEVTHAGGSKRPWNLGDYIASWDSECCAGAAARCLAHCSRLMPFGADYPYLRGWSYDRELPELIDDIQVPSWAHDFFDKLPVASRPPFHWIFMGPASTSTPLHVDPLLTHAWLSQVRPSRCPPFHLSIYFRYMAENRSPFSRRGTFLCSSTPWGALVAAAS